MVVALRLVGGKQSRDQQGRGGGMYSCVATPKRRVRRAERPWHVVLHSLEPLR